MQLSRRPMVNHRAFRHSRSHALVLISTVIVFLMTPLAAHAQIPNSFVIPPYVPQEIPDLEDGEDIVEVADVGDALPLIIDTDPGVDDAVALAWLLSVLDDSDILGIVTVAGNTTVENATANVHTVLAWMREIGEPVRRVTVIEGAKKPLVKKLSSTGLLIHGKDGLWSQQMAQTAKQQPVKARDFYCSNAQQNPAATILALGPLTNLAEAIRHCPQDMQAYKRIVVLGGAKFGGNTTPVAEFNFWQDPEAAQIVLSAGLNIHIVPLDAFTQLGFTQEDFFAIITSPVPVFQHLTIPLQNYAGAQILAGVPFSIPDLVAAIYTLEGLGQPLPALVEVMDKPSSVRGLSIIGLETTEKLTMIASDDELDAIAEQGIELIGDPLAFIEFISAQIGAILQRQPDNAQVVMQIRANAMRQLFLDQVVPTTSILEGAATDDDPANNDAGGLPENIYLPSVTSK